MRLILVPVALMLMLGPAVRAAPVDDPELSRALQICRSNGIDACLQRPLHVLRSVVGEENLRCRAARARPWRACKW